jgi:acetyl esterase
VYGDLETHDGQCRRLAAATGATVVAVDYRRAPEQPWPAAIDDAERVDRWAAGVADQVVVAGDSVGGLLAALVALRLRQTGEPALAGLLLVCPNTDLTLSQPSVAEKGTGWLLDADWLRWCVAQWVPDPALRGRPEVSPLAADLADLPPTLLVTAEHDPLRDEGNRYAERLAAAGVRVVHRCEPGQLHNFPSLRQLSPAAAAAEDRFLADAAALVAEVRNTVG